MATVPALLPTNLKRRAEVTAKALPADVPPLRWYTVLEDRNVPRPAGAGGGTFLLKKGKEISSGSYDIKKLKAAGVTLREIETPAWFHETQASARERHQQLYDAGLDVGDVPEPYEAPKVEKGKGGRPPANPAAAGDDS